MANSIFIGIDPAFRNNGFAIAIIDKSDNTVRFKVFKSGFLDFVSWFLYDSPDNAIVCIENSNLQNKTFSYYKGNRKELEHISRSVGKNQAISQCVVDLCSTKYPVIDCSPKQKGKKWNSDTFKRTIKKYNHIIKKKTSNQDERDAYKLALIALEQPYLAKKK
jgi:tRNA uridine 5-carbamoylmethylation protein Kti12